MGYNPETSDIVPEGPVPVFQRHPTIRRTSRLLRGCLNPSWVSGLRSEVYALGRGIRVDSPHMNLCIYL